MSTGAATLGEALAATGAVLIYVSAALDGAVHELRTTRRVGRVVLVVAGWLVHPLIVLHRRLGESPTARCDRAGHRSSWDGYHERCTRCERLLLEVTDEPSWVLDDDAPTHEEWVYPDDPRVVPGTIRPPTSPSGVSSAWTVNLRADVEVTLRADAERLRDDVRRVFGVSPTVGGRDPLRDLRFTRTGRLTRTERLTLEQLRDELRPYRPRDNPWR